MKILISGSSGFIGTNLVESLKKDGHEIFGLDCESSNPAFRCDLGFVEEVVDYAERIFLVHRSDKIKPDLIVHLAAMGNVTRCKENPTRAWECNVLGFSNMIELARLVGCKNVVYASSSSIYAAHPTPHDSHLPPLPKTFYGHTKAVNEYMAHAANDAYGINFVGLRLFNVFGPHQKIKGGYSAILPLAIKAISEGAPVPLYNEGKNERSFTPVSYVCEVIKYIMKSDFSKLPKIMNVGSEKALSVLDLIGLVGTVLQTSPLLEMKQKREWEIEKSRATMLRESMLPGFPKVWDEQFVGDLTKMCAGNMVTGV